MSRNILYHDMKRKFAVCFSTEEEFKELIVDFKGRSLPEKLK